MADIFREVDEELQQERAAKLWKKYGGWVIAAALALILGVAGNVYWSHYQEQSRADQAAALEAALLPLAEQRPAEAARALDAFAADASDGYAMLARFRRAAALVAAGDIEAAASVYREIAAADGTPSPYAALAAVKGVRLEIGAAPADELRERLTPALEPASPWRPLARETEALIALADGDTENAASVLRELIQDAETPEALRARATELVAALDG